MEAGADYLDSRGIPADLARRWQLGVVTTPVPGHERYTGRLAIPYITPHGPVGMTFRCIRQHSCKEADCVKYLAESGQRRGLYNVSALHVDTDLLVLCEGELDALSVHGLAGVPAVGIPGANKWEKHWSLLFDGYDEIVLAADGDDAGRQLAATVRGHLPHCRAVVLPDGHDANSYINTHGPDALRKKMGLELGE